MIYRNIKQNLDYKVISTKSLDRLIVKHITPEKASYSAPEESSYKAPEKPTFIDLVATYEEPESSYNEPEIAINERAKLLQ